MDEIRGDAKSIRSLLGNTKFTIDYYQREYKWETKQVNELIEDLAEKFQESHDPGNDRLAVKDYGHYFLGSIIISVKDGNRYIIDGQQRLTTLTLLLIHIYRKLEDNEQKGQLAELIFSKQYGRRSFNLNVEERAQCMEALFTGSQFDDSDQPESIINIISRYQDIEDNFPDELNDEALPYFADWLIENVHFVEITAYSDADAYTIFETMNDRGLSLTPTDMLKGYLLANITDTDSRNEASQVWRRHISSLRDIGKEEEADAIKSWLRSQYAKTIRERKAGAQPKDFDLIGTEFHRWVRGHENDLCLKGSSDFLRFIKENFSFYAHWYERIRKASENKTEGLETIHFNNQNNFTLQYPVLLAPLRKEDNEHDILKKLRIVSKYLDILITRRIWNWRSIGYSAMQYAMFTTISKIRGKTVDELAVLLLNRLSEEDETFASNDRLRLHGANGKYINRLLARMTDYIETKSGRASRYHEYTQQRGANRYEVEHIWANHPGRHRDEFQHPNDFFDYRNRLGGLLLLPKSFNASYSDKPYREKREYYYSQNLLAQSLHEKAYELDPGFRRFIEKSGLEFRPHSDFKKADLDARQELYRNLAEQIWDPEELRRELTG